MPTKLLDGLAPMGAKAQLYTSTVDILRATGINVDAAVPKVVAVVETNKL